MRNIQIDKLEIIKSSDIYTRQFKIVDIDEIHQLISFHLNHTYSKVYSPKIVEFYKKYHSKESLLHDAQKGHILITICNNEIIGTGTILKNYINRMFVKSGFQYNGIGTVILTELEKIAIKNKCKEIKLDAIPGSVQFYQKLGYKLINKAFDMVNNEKLEYFKMKKSFNQGFIY